MSVDPGFGTVYGSAERPSYITDEGVEVWMWRKGQKVRFYDVDGRQHGPEQSNVVPAICFAAYYGWVDPSAPELSRATTAEVRAKTTFKGEGET